MPRRAWFSTRSLALATAMICAGVSLGAQAAARTHESQWLSRVSISARYDEFHPAGHSEIYSLVDRALSPGANALRPQLVDGELHLRAARRWDFVLGVERGGTTVASTSKLRPASATDDVHQLTNLDLSSAEYVGAEWTALRWGNADREGPDRLRVLLGAGAGVANYRLRQWGDFVDTQREAVFHDDLRSTGRGVFSYLNTGLNVPIRRWIAAEGELRYRSGSAPMTADYASFDRIDLSGFSAGVGLRWYPFASSRE